MPGRLEDRVAIVTGGSRGIGRAVVERFAAEGAKVWFTYIRHEEAAREVEAAVPGAVAILCDGRDPAAVEAALQTVLARDGRVDILVNNAGVAHNGLFAMMPADNVRQVLDANVLGTVNWARAVFRPMLLRKSGSIVNVASVAGLFGLPGQVAYSMSKGAIMSLTRGLAAEAGGKGIRVNSLVPGFVDTDMTASIPSPARRNYRERIVMGRFGRPEEVSAAALFLASDESSYITGQALVVDGGLSVTVI
jgi:3-oxoacyl-[acyl-carrier protein] reductase